MIVMRRAERLLARAGDEFRALILVDDLEAEGNIRLEGKQMKDGFTETMNRLDFETSRRLDGAGEQFARDRCKPRIVRRSRRAYRRFQLDVV